MKKFPEHFLLKEKTIRHFEQNRNFDFDFPYEDVPG